MSRGRGNGVRVGVLALVMLLGGAPSAAIELDRTEVLRAIQRMFCGPDHDRCDRITTLSPVELRDLGDELARCVAQSEFLDSLSPDERLFRSLERFCEDEPLRCAHWALGFARSGAIDADLDGVIDPADRCPATDALAGRARRLVLAQGFAIEAVFDVLVAVRLRLIEGVNGTLSAQERSQLGRQIEFDLFDLVDVANATENGRFLFAGSREDVAPFALEGEFGPGAVPAIHYLGDDERLVWPVGPDGAPRALTIPGSSLFLGQPVAGVLDGRFPFDLFALVLDVWAHLMANDLYALRWDLAGLDEAIGFQVFPLRNANAALYASLLRTFPEPELAPVDASGCSAAQFCAAVPVGGPRGVARCLASDFRNDEPLARYPGDCWLQKDAEGISRCTARGGPPATGGPRRK